jgi:NAD(P)H-nitrite reductase large subunit
MDSFCPRDCGPCTDAERLVCRCLRVAEETVTQAITTLGLRTVREVRQHTGAGDGCTACHGRLTGLLEARAYSCSSALPICSAR